MNDQLMAPVFARLKSEHEDVRDDIFPDKFHRYVSASVSIPPYELRFGTTMMFAERDVEFDDFEVCQEGKSKWWKLSLHSNEWWADGNFVWPGECEETERAEVRSRQEATLAYRAEREQLESFIADECEVGSEQMVECGQFRRAFQAATGNKVRAAAMRSRMDMYGFGARKRQSKQMFMGLCLRSE